MHRPRPTLTTQNTVTSANNVEQVVAMSNNSTRAPESFLKIGGQ
ncbi:hypothetical protein HMPREF1861_00046 [Corynebacterium kroppenstedtii]|nr:hypothetical protein HMPREF1861_00046 [Corynebacterium kroppenstedtii]